MPIVNADIAAVFGNPFRIRAYRNAARTLSELGRSFRAVPGAKQAVAADSLRRMRDLDLLVTISRSSPLMERFVDGSDVHRVRSQGATPASVVLRSGLQVDLRGDLHSHSKASDSHDTLEAMAAAARTRGLQYLAVTEHSKRFALVHGLDAGRLARQSDQIDELNARLRGIVLLKGVEVDILEDGSLDMTDVACRMAPMGSFSFGTTRDLNRSTGPGDPA